jgi:hypothetical protein
MTRLDDQPVPAVVLEDHVGRPRWWAGHGQLVVALERLPQAAYVWDDVDPDVVWDDADPQRVWDAPFIGSGFTDVYCDLVSLDIVNGEPDGFDNYRAPYLTMVLRDPGDGRYRSRTVDGRLLYWSVGRRVAVWWHDEHGVDWWRFSGRIAVWRDPMLTSDVTIEAYGGLAELSRPMGREWTAGAAGNYPSQRVPAILAAAGYTGPVRTDLGDVTLSVPAPADVLPIDALRRAVRSDGGIAYSDADDTLITRDRRWRGGRPDQTRFTTFTDNVCDLGPSAVVLWDVTAADLDLRLAGTLRFGNDAVPPLTASATNPGIDPAVIFTHPDPDLWQTQGQGNELAAYSASNRADARLALGNAAVYLHDVRFDYWHQALELRIGDLARFQHTDTFTDPPRTDVYDVNLVVTTIRDHVTADGWTVELTTSPAVTYTLVELWDLTRLMWDDPSPLAVWR